MRIATRPLCCFPSAAYEDMHTNTYPLVPGLTNIPSHPMHWPTHVSSLCPTNGFNVNFAPAPLLFVYTICYSILPIYFAYWDILGRNIDHGMVGLRGLWRSHRCAMHPKVHPTEKTRRKKSRKCLQLSVCSNCDQICGSSEQLKANLCVEFLHTNPCLSQFLNSAQSSPFIISVGGNLKSACVFLVSAAHNSRRRQHPAQSWCLFTSEFSAQSRFIAALCCIQVPWDTATLPYKDDSNESSHAAKFRNLSLF